MDRVSTRRAIMAGPGAGLCARLISEMWDDISAGKKVVVFECGGYFEAFSQVLNSGAVSDGQQRSAFIKLSRPPNISFDKGHDLTVFDFYDVLYSPGYIKELCGNILYEIVRSPVSKIIIVDEHCLPTVDILAVLWACQIEIDVCFWSVECLQENSLHSYKFDELSQHLVANEKQIEALIATSWVPEGMENFVWEAHKKASYKKGFVQTISLNRETVLERNFGETSILSSVFDRWRISGV